MSFAVTELKDDKVLITEDVYVRDQYGIRRHTFVKGDEIPRYVYNAVMKTNTLVVEDVLEAVEEILEPEEVEQSVEEPVVETVEAVEELGETLEKAGMETKALKPRKARKKKK
jgi:hypothetical protein